MSKTPSNHFPLTGRTQRRRRVRGKIFGTPTRPRLTVFRSNRWLYAQVVDDEARRTLLGLSNRQIKPAIPVKTDKKSPARRKMLLAKQLGLALAERARGKKITQVVFDRQGYHYAGRVQAFAEGARAGGLIF